MKADLFFRELEKQNLSQLERSTDLSRQALHAALKSKNMQLKNLESVAKAMNYQVVMLPSQTEENVLASLKKWGAPVAHSADGTLDLENAVVAAMKLSRKEGLYESLTPYVLVRNVSRLKLLRLMGLAMQEDCVQVLGYFVDMANAFHPQAKFEKLLELLLPMRPEKKEMLVLSEKANFPELFGKNQAALRWNLLVRGRLEDHLHRWEQWEKSHKKT